MRVRHIAAALLFVFFPFAARAGDESNLQEGYPLRLTDASPIAEGRFVLDKGFGWHVERDSPDRLYGTADILYGAAPNLQLDLGVYASTQPDDIIASPRSWDLHAGALYQFIQEAPEIPAFALEVALNIPTGHRSKGLDTEIKAILTKSFDPVSIHFNAAYEFVGDDSHDKQSGRYKCALGPSLPLGDSADSDTTLLADVFFEEAPLHHQSETLGAEIGFSHQLTPRTVLDAGVGSEFAGDARSPFYFTVGLGISF